MSYEIEDEIEQLQLSIILGSNRNKRCLSNDVSKFLTMNFCMKENSFDAYLRAFILLIKSFSINTIL